MSNTDLDIAKKLEQTRVIKYWKSEGHVKIKLDWLQELILILAIVVRHSQRVYNILK